MDAGFVPGTGWPEPGGLLPREALKIVEGIAKEGIVAMEVVEVSPPYDIAGHHVPAGCPAHGGRPGGDGEEQPDRRPLEDLSGWVVAERPSSSPTDLRPEASAWASLKAQAVEPSDVC